MYPLSRRTFIRQAACAALGTSGLLSTIWDLRKLSAATFSGATDFKALVCVFLYGGNDGNNMVVPYDAPSYASYAATRKSLAIPWLSLLPLTPLNGNGLSLAFHPSMTELQALFNQGKLAIVANVGTLVAPVTKEQILSGSAAVPPEPFFARRSGNAVANVGLEPTIVHRMGWPNRGPAPITQQQFKDFTYNFCRAHKYVRSGKHGLSVSDFSTWTNPVD